jgi:hypothetical protein
MASMTGIIKRYPVAEISSFIPWVKVAARRPILKCEASLNWKKIKKSRAAKKNISQNKA